MIVKEVIKVHFWDKCNLSAIHLHRNTFFFFCSLCADDEVLLSQCCNQM